MFILFFSALSVLIAMTMIRDYKEKRLPSKLTLNTFNNYVNSDHHWHSAGHFLVQFMFVQVFGTYSITGLIIGVGLSAISPFFIEMVLQKNKLTNKDTIYDIFTHLLGTLAGLSLFL